MIVLSSDDELVNNVGEKLLCRKTMLFISIASDEVTFKHLFNFEIYLYINLLFDSFQY